MLQLAFVFLFSQPFVRSPKGFDMFVFWGGGDLSVVTEQ